MSPGRLSDLEGKCFTESFNVGDEDDRVEGLVYDDNHDHDPRVDERDKRSKGT